MRKFLLLLLVAGTAAASDVHYMWLPFSNNVPGAPQTTSDAARYGINVFLNSDNPSATEFQVAAVVRLSDGDIRVISGTAARLGKAAGVQYSTLCSIWVDTAPNFEVLAIEVKAISAVAATRPLAGTPY